MRSSPTHSTIFRLGVLLLCVVLAALSGTGFTAVSRHGWSVVVFDAEVDFWAVRTGLAETAVALSSDGATRSFEVLLAGEDPARCATSP